MKFLLFVLAGDLFFMIALLDEVRNGGRPRSGVADTLGGRIKHLYRRTKVRLWKKFVRRSVRVFCYWLRKGRDFGHPIGH